MTQSLKRFASAVLALVMAMTCLVFSNVASVSAAEGDTLVDVSSEVTFTLNKNLNNVGTSTVTGDYTVFTMIYLRLIVVLGILLQVILDLHLVLTVH